MCGVPAPKWLDFHYVGPVVRPRRQGMPNGGESVRSVQWRIWGGHVVMALLCGAGLLKLADLDSFRYSLDSWVLVPLPLRLIAVYLVPTGEVFIGMSWLFGVGRTWVLWGALLLLTLFGVIYGVHALTVGPPTCQCFGKLSEYHAFRASARSVIVQDAIMCIALLLALSAARSSASAAIPVVAPTRS